MILDPFVTWTLVGIILVVLVLPFMSKRVEHNLEAFLFVMGVLSVTVSGLWSSHLVMDALLDPIRIQHPIVEAVLLAGLLFRAFRDAIRRNTMRCEQILGPRLFIFSVVVALGLLSSVITAIIAALVLSEIVTGLRLDKKTETRLVIVTCFSIGLGAALTPIGEPLSTIAVAKLRGDPYHAGFWFLFENLGLYILPGILALGLFAMVFHASDAPAAESLSEDRPETLADVFIRAAKVYLFVMALVLLGSGFKPVIDAYVIHLSSPVLYWINMISAVLDNATLAAAELSPKMELKQIQVVLMGLLISGGMLIPGNIPNIIAAGKLGIGSRQWAALGLPLGLVLMVIYFVVLFVLI
jgi:predicted cation transporter